MSSTLRSPWRAVDRRRGDCGDRQCHGLARCIYAHDLPASSRIGHQRRGAGGDRGAGSPRLGGRGLRWRQEAGRDEGRSGRELPLLPADAVAGATHPVHTHERCEGQSDREFRPNSGDGERRTGGAGRADCGRRQARRPGPDLHRSTARHAVAERHAGDAGGHGAARLEGPGFRQRQIGPAKPWPGKTASGASRCLRCRPATTS